MVNAIEFRKDCKRRIKMIERNLRENPNANKYAKKDAHGRISELKRELRDSYKLKTN